MDEVSTKNARRFKARNGSIGAGILKRFTVWFDYPNRKLMLKKNADFYKKFNYNMSGLDIVYNGKQLVKEQKETNKYKTTKQDENLNLDYNSLNYFTSYSYKFKHSYKIKRVIKDSPGYKVGLKVGDIIIRLNREFVYAYSLNQIIDKFQEKENKLIKMVVERDGKRMKVQFRLKKRI